MIPKTSFQRDHDFAFIGVFQIVFVIESTHNKANKSTILFCYYFP